MYIHWYISQFCVLRNPRSDRSVLPPIKSWKKKQKQKTDFLVRYFRKGSFSKNDLKATAPALSGGIYYNLAIKILKPHFIHVELQFLVMVPKHGGQRETKERGRALQTRRWQVLWAREFNREQISAPTHQNLKSVCGGHLDFSHRWSQQCLTL